jgi:trehalose synthase-fused probable maltokinase
MTALTLPRELLVALPRQRWFAGKSRHIADVRVLDWAPWVFDSGFWLVEVVYKDQGPSDRYVLVETFAGPENLDQADVADALLQHFRQGTTLQTPNGGQVVFCPTARLDSVPEERTRPAELLRGEQSNSSIRFGDALIFKLFRRIQIGGESPEVEIGRFLTERTSFTGTPAVAGSLEYRSPVGESASLGLLQAYVPNHGDAWRNTLDRLNDALSGSQSQEAQEAQESQESQESQETALAPVRRLGRVTAELHLALASDPSEPAFAPELIDEHDVHAWGRDLLDEIERTAAELARSKVHVDVDALRARAAGLDALVGSRKARHHGDYHLGQVLERNDGDFAIIDFEGEPSRALAARREKRSPLRDVAGMLRSLDYARHAALRAGDAEDPARRQRADGWHAQARDGFLSTYLGTVNAASPGLLPARDRIGQALSALELEKAAYEVRYELSHRPDWLPIPLAAVRHTVS